MGTYKGHTLVGAGIALLLGTSVVAQSTLSPIKQLLAGSGLVGGGTGPTVTLGIGPGLVTSSHVQDGSLQVSDLSSAARTALQGAQGPAGPAGPQGPQGIPGLPGPAAATPTVLNRALAANQSVPTDQETSLPGLTTNFTLAEERCARICAQVSFSDTYTRPLRIAVVVDGQVAATMHGRIIDDNFTPPFFHTLSTQRSLKLPAGAHTIDVRVLSGFNYRTAPCMVLGPQTGV